MSLCSLELVSLLLAGRAHGHCLAYHPLTRVRHLAWVRPDALSSSSTTKSGRMSGEGAATAAAPGHASSSNGLTLSGGSGAEVTHGMHSSGKRIGTQDDNDDDATAEVKAPPPSSESSSLGVGFLSVAEKEAGQPIADDLKSPTTPVRICEYLHCLLCVSARTATHLYKNQSLFMLSYLRLLESYILPLPRHSSTFFCGSNY